MRLEGIDRQFITERDVLEEMEDGNDAQVLGMDNRIHSIRDLALLKLTLGWQEHAAEWEKDFRESEKRFAQEAEKKDRRYWQDLAEAWSIRITI